MNNNEANSIPRFSDYLKKSFGNTLKTLLAIFFITLGFSLLFYLLILLFKFNYGFLIFILISIVYFSLLLLPFIGLRKKGIFLPKSQLSKLILKRSLDIIVSIIFLIVAFPILVLIIIMIGIDSPGPIFTTKETVGLCYQRFSRYKFRVRRSHNGQGGAIRNQNDLSFTRVGILLRKSSIEELPLIINVLLGDMSMVGPLPRTQGMLSEYSINSRIFSFPPGITGLSQIKSDNNWELSDFFEKDLEYVDSWNFFLDIKIMLLTPLAVFTR